MLTPSYAAVKNCQPDILAAIAAVQTARAAWTCADWTHESQEVDEDGDPIYCSGGDVDDCPTCYDAKISAESAASEGYEAITCLRAGDVDGALAAVERAAALERAYGDDPVWSIAVAAVKALAACECGEATGERCAWEGPASDLVVIDWMPEHLRASHAAAGNEGVYPHNGALRLRVAPDCAVSLREDAVADEENVITAAALDAENADRLVNARVRCVSDRYDAWGKVPYADVAEFLNMCRDCFDGAAPALTEQADGWHDETGALVLVRA